MSKAFGFALATALLLTSCGDQGQNQNANQNQRPSNVATPAANTTPAASAPSSAQTAPMTATVKNSGLSWKDDASGTPVTTIKVGGTVTWTVTGHHTLERVAASAANGCEELEDSFNADFEDGKPVTRTFTKAGTFGYHCGVHGGNPNCKTPPGTGRMPGVIKVVP